MDFAPDTLEALTFAVALGNTTARSSRNGADELSSLAGLSDLIAHYPFSGRIDGDESELRDVVLTRERLREMWTMVPDSAALAINKMLEDARARPYLARHDGLDWHLHATSPEAPLGERMRVEGSLALMDVIRTGETRRLRICEADECEGLILDLSRNLSKRFCSARCGSRTNMAAYRKRQHDHV
ncbi:CGNR zinc finger domain-containing protein [Cryobacterium lactosi]|uniref:CGNR zinc finger domain-containing protein n=1 Tax=Cryobacterium lactosi TaxID=1259202 RepID=A0A4R9BWR1_9MICO|nr:CGNR zinc finger domain-containing protein [Cryobacterium lactosi]TFD93052.1 CGNR zinc finger domain-containing protein [Cryobacterium lactosi]